MGWDYEAYLKNPNAVFQGYVTNVANRMVITPEMYGMLPVFKDLIFNSEFSGPREPYAMLLHKEGG